MKRTLQLLLLVCSTLLTLVGAEMGLRLYHRSRMGTAGDFRQRLEQARRIGLEEEGATGHLEFRDLIQASDRPDLVFEIKPGLDGVFKGGRVKTNSWGFRGREVELDKPPGTFRIVGIGDSVMFGWGVDQGGTYLDLLERELNSLGGPRFEVLNLAVPGYNTVMEVETFVTKGLSFEPDLALIHFYPNDLEVPGFLQSPRHFRLRKKDFYLLRIARAALGRLDRDNPRRRLLMRKDRLQHHGEDPEEVLSAYRHMAGEGAFVAALKRLAALGRQHSIPIAVLMLDEQGRGELVHRVAEKEGFPVINASAQFRAHLRQQRKNTTHWKETFWVGESDPHPNAVGHVLFAQALLDGLRDKGLIPVEPDA